MEDEKGIFCSKCGGKLDEDDKFCPDCGKSQNITESFTQNKFIISHKKFILPLIVVVLTCVLAVLVINLAFPDTHAEFIEGYKFNVPSEFKASGTEIVVSGKQYNFENSEGNEIRILVSKGALINTGLYEYVYQTTAAKYLGVSETKINGKETYTIQNMNYYAYNIANGNDYIMVDFDKEISNRHEIVEKITKDL
ncbi:MAG: hypothetical protein FWE58_00485 [Methanobrevibacter sp.]|nr:hypothetical protein [Methanobrevibacter sp.]